jgi:phosphatidylglycerophosphate synthase
MKWHELRAKCKRDSDYIITLFITNEISLALTWLLVKTPITPNQVTLASIACSLLCGLFYLSGWFITGSLFLFISHILDCTDGNLARAKGEFSVFGRWIDFVGDRIADVFIFLSISIYFIINDRSTLWALLPLLEASLFMLYYYIVDIGLSLGISKTKQEITSFSFKGVHVKWGLLEPVIYGFIILTPFGLIKLQVILLLILVISGLAYQIINKYSLYKSS